MFVYDLISSKLLGWWVVLILCGINKFFLLILLQVQNGSRFYTISTAIVSGCLFLSNMNYFIINSWLKVYLQHVTKDISLAFSIPEFLLYSGSSEIVSTIISWLSVQTDWINNKLDVSELNVSSVLTGICMLLHCFDCIQHRNTSTMLNLASWSILFGLSFSPKHKQTDVLIKAVEVKYCVRFIIF